MLVGGGGEGSERSIRLNLSGLDNRSAQQNSRGNQSPGGHANQSEVQRKRTIPSRQVLVKVFDEASPTSSVRAMLTARGCQDPDLLSLS